MCKRLLIHALGLISRNRQSKKMTSWQTPTSVTLLSADGVLDIAVGLLHTDVVFVCCLQSARSGLSYESARTMKSV